MTIKLGTVEKVCLGMIALTIIVSLLPVGPIARVFISIPTYLLGIWCFFRISRKGVQHAIWRLRNRLLVAYIFIALVPIVLIVTLVALGGYLVGGQLSIYLISTEMDRRTAAMRTVAEQLLRTPVERSDAISFGSDTRMILQQGSRTWIYPPGQDITPPAQGWGDASGVVSKDGNLYLWAHLARNNATATVFVPLTNEYMGELANGLGQVDILNLGGGFQGRSNLLRSGANSLEPSKNRVPPSVNAFDWQVHWPSPLPIAEWNKAGQYVVEATMIVSTRPSAVLRTVMPQRLEFAAEFIPALFLTVAILFLITELIALVIGVTLTRTITAAVHDLYQGTLRVTKGDFSHRIPPHGRDQLGELVSSFNQMSENLERLVRVEKERERLQNELEIAREVQNQLYPRTVPTLKSLRIKAACQPARMVSGDYYDYQRMQQDGAAIAMGDVAGKGISAALLMATVQSSFRTELRGSVEMARAVGNRNGSVELLTSELVSHLNHQIYNFTSPEKYTTFFLGFWNDTERKLTYTNAGHLPPILIHDGSVSRLAVNGIVVGAFPFAKYDSSELFLSPGDLLVFFTDGITEPENEYGEDFGEERLINLLLKNVHLPEDALIQLIMDAAQQWSGKSELQDDMTLVMVRCL